MLRRFLSSAMLTLRIGSSLYGYYSHKGMYAVASWTPLPSSACPSQSALAVWDDCCQGRAPILIDKPQHAGLDLRLITKGQYTKPGFAPSAHPMGPLVSTSSAHQRENVSDIAALSISPVSRRTMHAYVRNLFSGCALLLPLAAVLSPVLNAQTRARRRPAQRPRHPSRVPQTRQGRPAA